MALINCPECGKQVSNTAKSCPNCGTPIDTAVHCPKCGNSNTKVISGGSKVFSMLMWGPFAANKIISKYQCRKCGHKF